MKFFNKLVKKIFGYFNDIRLFFWYYKFNKIDSVIEFDKFAKLCKDFIGKNIWACFSCNGENAFYGHYKALREYSGLYGNKWCKGLTIEHGIRLYNMPISRWCYDLYFSFIFQGPFREDDVRNFDETALFYSIGPYIYYAKKHIDDNTFVQLKKSLGNTLLIIPNHTFEGTILKRDLSVYYKKFIADNENKYDTLLVCVYWHDIEDPLFDLFKKCKKVRFVSAGVRFDDKFINRLRTIFELSDEIICNSISTHIGYALCLNKKIKFIDTGDDFLDNSQSFSREEIESRNKIKNKIIIALNSNSDKEIKCIYDKIFGGKNIKTKEELKEIFYESYAQYRFNKKRRFKRIINIL